MRVLVSGASGFVGGALARTLVARGHEVVGLSRRPGPVPGLYGLLEANIADTLAAARIVAKLNRCEAIVHAAAALEDGTQPGRMTLTNCLGTEQLVAVAREWQVSSFVFVSSLPVIGSPRELPITEHHATAPRTAYHASKLYGEQLVCLLCDEGVAASALRLTAPVGPGMPSGRILSVFVQRALAGEPLVVAGHGTRMQDYVDVRDVARATDATLSRRATGVINIASGSCISNLDLARRCVSVLGSNSDVRLSGGDHPEDGTRWEVSVARAREVIDYVPHESLESSITAVAGDHASGE